MQCNKGKEERNPLLEKLQGGSLISDGRANEVADQIIADPQLLPKLAEGLRDTDKVVRARTAHSLERISRQRPELLNGLLSELLALALHDPVPMVRWHIPMILANIKVEEEYPEAIFETLYSLLIDNSVLVKSWTIASLTILSGKQNPWHEETIRRLRPMTKDVSDSVRTRAVKALNTLEKNQPIPQGWQKG
jgi:HEAT repeat protein